MKMSWYGAKNVKLKTLVVTHSHCCCTGVCLNTSERCKCAFTTKHLCRQTRAQLANRADDVHWDNGQAAGQELGHTAREAAFTAMKVGHTARQDVDQRAIVLATAKKYVPSNVVRHASNGSSLSETNVANSRAFIISF
ncbi:uncharacterized protein LOC142591435 [Dermacentor variabilis]|uniref:uncharacterized protein LOC142591435 n=1 Tax=Dermacentor variabilis TaxID=34621 RepID=UPI003F5BF4C8